MTDIEIYNSTGQISEAFKRAVRAGKIPAPVPMDRAETVRRTSEIGALIETVQRYANMFGDGETNLAVTVERLRREFMEFTARLYGVTVQWEEGDAPLRVRVPDGPQLVED